MAIGFGDLRFKIHIECLRPNDNAPGAHNPASQDWLPPDVTGAFDTRSYGKYRWIGGKITKLPDNTRLQTEKQLRSATMFTQYPGSDHLVAVDFDARTREVRSNGRWRKLGFDRIPTGTSNHVRTSILPAGQHERLPCPLSPALRKLLPACYKYINPADAHGMPAPPKKTNEGIIGDLPILIGLAAFSGPETRMDQVLQSSVQPHMWVAHGFADGRAISRRGLVITIYRDDANLQYSTEKLLDDLRDGRFGSFYKC